MDYNKILTSGIIDKFYIEIEEGYNKVNIGSYYYKRGTLFLLDHYSTGRVAIDTNSKLYPDYIYTSDGTLVNFGPTNQRFLVSVVCTDLYLLAFFNVARIFDVDDTFSVFNVTAAYLNDASVPVIRYFAITNCKKIQIFLFLLFNDIYSYKINKIS